MKNIRLGLLVCLSLLWMSISAQKIASTSYKANHEGWLVSLEEAHVLSNKTGKPILANFTGSDWCGWCKRLSANVFDHKEFQDWAKQNVILLELDYPRGKQIPQDIASQNSNLQQAFGITGFPTIWVFKVKKEKEQYNIIPYGKTTYAQDVPTFTGAVKQIMDDAKSKGI